jgi:glycosyltransferase involved in cell wall biosynthesis
MRRLRASIERQGLAKTSTFLDPRAQINLFANIVRNPYSKPYVFRVDGAYFDSAETSGSNETLNRPIYEGIDGACGVVIQSHFDLELVRSFGRVDRPYEIINNGTDLTLFCPDGPDMKGALGIEASELVVLTSAKWRAHKRLDDIVEVFLEFSRRKAHPCRLLILGDTAGVSIPADGWSSQLPQNAQVTLVGHVQPDDLPAWYRTGDVFLYLSWLDHCPNSVVEAIACGLPVVCSNQGGTRELVEMSNAGVVAEADSGFTFELVDLYHPPKPSCNVILEALEDVVHRLDEYRLKIDRGPLDIDVVARRYVCFLETMVRAGTGVDRHEPRDERRSSCEL